LKHDFLKHPTSPMDVSDKTIGDLIEGMGRTGFQGRKLGESLDVWLQMLEDNRISVFLGLSGAMVPAGMRRILSFLIESRAIDCLVSTGANLFHDAYEALGGHHYLGSENADDTVLFKAEIDRIHDVYASEQDFRKLDLKIAEFAMGLESGKAYSSRELMHLFGKMIHELGGAKDSILTSAYRNSVPIYAPSLSDSSIGIGLTVARRKGHPVTVDHIKDVDELTSIVEASKKTGVIYVGGGVPKNFIQQTEVVASMFGLEEMGHEYAIQYTTDSPQWGGLSGCTFEEAVSWGKIHEGAKKVQVFVDATIALPIISHALFEKSKDILKKRKKPKFNVEGEKLEISF